MKLLPLLVLLLLLSGCTPSPTADATFASSQTSSEITPGYLRTEYRQNPVLDEIQPRLSWVLESDVRGQRQTAYQVLVASSPDKLNPEEADLWDSGKVPGDQTAQVVYEGKRLTSRQMCYWKVRSWDKDGNPGIWSEPARWEMGLLAKADWKAKWVGLDLNHLGQDVPYKGKKLHLPPAPYLRKAVELPEPVRKARLYVTALGLYEFSINGQRVGHDYLAPGWTDYDKRVYYLTYDVTENLREGPNVLGSTLSYGWYAGYLGYALLTGNPTVRAFYGEVPALLAQLEIEYADGRKEIIATDDSWKASSGPLLETDILHGETYDARQELAGWQQASYNDGSWRPATVFPVKERQIQCYPAQPVQVTEVLQPKSVKPRPGGKYIFDLGQNIAGVVKLKVKGKAGDKVTLRFGEMLHPDGRLMLENLRLARATDTYILKGDPNGEEWTPGFTYHGFQYVEVEGYPGVPTAEAITGLVLGSNTPRTGSFETNDPMLNRLYHNIVWSQRGNFVDIPTDCPQRDERLGWTGDAQIFIPTATLNMDVAAFFTKWLTDLNDSQWPDGSFPDYVPAPPIRHTDTFSPGWMEAGVICPYHIYQAYGDTRVIGKAWPHMEKFMAFHEKRSQGQYLYPEGSFDDLDPRGGYGDWLSIGKKTPPDLMATLYYGYTASLMAEMARAIGKTNRALHYQEVAEKVKAAFGRHYMDPDGRFKTDTAAYGTGSGYVDGQMGFDGHTQSAYAKAIYMGFLTPEQQQQAGQHLAGLIRQNGHKLTTGFLGTKSLLPALSATGQSDLAYALLLQKEYPSWGFEIENGANTIWERWNSYVKNGSTQASLNAGMNSFNHYAFGAVYEWMFRNMAGIQAAAPGYKEIVIKPEIDGTGKVNQIDTRYTSMQGPIRSAWQVQGANLQLEVSVPVNVTATIHIPAADAATVRESGWELSEAEGVLFKEVINGKVVVQVGSGTFRFTSKLPGSTAGISKD
jgi:alpha-L-rhamnosidase